MHPATHHLNGYVAAVGIISLAAGGAPAITAARGKTFSSSSNAVVTAGCWVVGVLVLGFRGGLTTMLWMLSAPSTAAARAVVVDAGAAALTLALSLLSQAAYIVLSAAVTGRSYQPSPLALISAAGGTCATVVVR